MDISDPFVGLCTMKKADGGDAVILRLVEMEGIDKDIEVRLPFKAASITRCNLVEEVLGPFSREPRTAVSISLSLFCQSGPSIS